MTGVLAVIFFLTLLCSPCKETICQHCGRDFKVLGRHVWRCKARIFTDQPTAPPNNHMVTAQETVNYAESANISPVNLNNVHNENLLDAYIIYITNYDKELQDEGPNNLFRDTEMECCCRKKLKGLKGLRAHRRFCHVGSTPDLNTLFALEDLTQCSVRPFSTMKRTYHTRKTLNPESNYRSHQSNVLGLTIILRTIKYL